MTFAPGRSGNPAGRPKSANALAAQRQKLVDAGPAVIATLIKNAKAGDPTALRLYMERVMPALRPESRPVQVDAPADATPTEMARHALQAAFRGEITSNVAHDLASALAVICKVEELDELRREIDDLKRQIHGETK